MGGITGGAMIYRRVDIAVASFILVSATFMSVINRNIHQHDLLLAVFGCSLAVHRITFVHFG